MAATTSTLASLGPGANNWFGMADIPGFLGNRNVNVVSPLGGQFSWWTDWVNDRASNTRPT